MAGDEAWSRLVGGEPEVVVVGGHGRKRGGGVLGVGEDGVEGQLLFLEVWVGGGVSGVQVGGDDGLVPLVGAGGVRRYYAARVGVVVGRHVVVHVVVVVGLLVRRPVEHERGQRPGHGPARRFWLRRVVACVHVLDLEEVVVVGVQHVHLVLAGLLDEHVCALEPLQVVVLFARHVGAVCHEVVHRGAAGRGGAHLRVCVVVFERVCAGHDATELDCTYFDAERSVYRYKHRTYVHKP